MQNASDGWNPSLFTKADEDRERELMTREEVAASTADMFGLAESVSNCEQPEDVFLPETLYMLDAELDKIPSERKSVFLQAQQRCPELLDDKQKESFLRAEKFDGALAAERLVLYWETKRKLFGSKCFLPVTLRGTLRDDDIQALSAIGLHLLPVKDKSGRAILFFRAPPDLVPCNDESLVQALWYIMHAAIEDPEVQRRGVVTLASFQDPSFLQHLEEQRLLRTFYQFQLCIPMRLCAQHFLQPGPGFHEVMCFAQAAMGKRLRQRLKVHVGQKEDILRSLSNYGFSPDKLPLEIGGAVVIDKDAWKISRLALEDHRILTKACPDIPSSSENTRSALGELCVGVQLRSDTHESGSSPQIFPLTASDIRKGPKGDPRMSGAIEARLRCPELSLLEALIAGGFEFPMLSNGEDLNKRHDQQICDADGVSLHQRKNQLLRRLRLTRKKMLKGV